LLIWLNLLSSCLKLVGFNPIFFGFFVDISALLPFSALHQMSVVCVSFYFIKWNAVKTETTECSGLLLLPAFGMCDKCKPARVDCSLLKINNIISYLRQNHNVWNNPWALGNTIKISTKNIKKNKFGVPEVRLRKRNSRCHKKQILP